MAKANLLKLSPQILYKALRKNKIDYYCGVPDSLVSSFCASLQTHSKDSHNIAANEGNAIGMAIGYHIATGKVPLVYMQNSGFNNALDPLSSLVDPSVLSIPMILLISWRGQPGTIDEPQHAKQGVITEELLVSLGISFAVLSRNTTAMRKQIAEATKYTTHYNKPYAFLVEKDTFIENDITRESVQKYLLSREEALGLVTSSLREADVIVSGIGKISRELFEYRDSKHEHHKQDLLVVGGMGHASSIALGVALQRQDVNIYCLDGDASVLMHMGVLSTIGHKKPKNFYHIVMNNGLHDSVGGQPTAGFATDIPGVAKACGYEHVFSVNESSELKKVIAESKDLPGPIMIEIRIHGGARPDLTRPSIPPVKNKESFMEYLKNGNP